MARKRQIDPSIWTSDDFMDLEDPWVMLLWIGLISNADDEGRMRASPRHIKAVIFPAIDHTLDNIRAWRDKIAAQGLITIYEVEGKEYLHIPNFTKYQYMTKRTPSQLPEPPVNNQLITSHQPVISIGNGNGIGNDNDNTLSPVNNQPSKSPPGTAQRLYEETLKKLPSSVEDAQTLAYLDEDFTPEQLWEGIRRCARQPKHKHTLSYWAGILENMRRNNEQPAPKSSAPPDAREMFQKEIERMEAESG
jgi:hypothetical protein